MITCQRFGLSLSWARDPEHGHHALDNGATPSMVLMLDSVPLLANCTSLGDIRGKRLPTTSLQDH